MTCAQPNGYQIIGLEKGHDPNTIGFKTLSPGRSVYKVADAMIEATTTDYGNPLPFFPLAQLSLAGLR
jgi:hypothetical protein